MINTKLNFKQYIWIKASNASVTLARMMSNVGDSQCTCRQLSQNNRLNTAPRNTGLSDRTPTAAMPKKIIPFKRGQHRKKLCYASRTVLRDAKYDAIGVMPMENLADEMIIYHL